MMRMCLLAERDEAVLLRLRAVRPTRPGHTQFPFYLPDEDALCRLCDDLRPLALHGGIDLELLWLDNEDSVVEAISKIEKNTLFIPFSDGYLPFLGTSTIGLLRGLGARVFGSGPMATASSQNKFLQYGLFSALGIPTPETWLFRHSKPEPSCSRKTYITKPNNLGNFIGIFDDAIDCDWNMAQAAAERVIEIYGVDAIIQEYIAGLYCRATFLGRCSDKITVDNIGLHIILEDLRDDDIQSHQFTDFNKYFESYKTIDKNQSFHSKLYTIDEAIQRCLVSEEARGRVRQHLTTLIEGTDLAGIFSIDIIISNEIPYFLEFNTNPFLRNAAIRDYCDKIFVSTPEIALFHAAKEAFTDV